jgi:hypothetical protein
MNKKIPVLEALIVVAILAVIAFAGGARFTDWSAACAVFFGFLHTQISFSLAEGRIEELPNAPGSLLKKIHLLKEATWITTFSLLGSWPLLGGAALFLFYPALRELLRAPRR